MSANSWRIAESVGETNGGDVVSADIGINAKANPSVRSFVMKAP